MSLLYKNKSGEAISSETWSRLLQQDAYRIIAVTETRGYSVSTIWIGLDHGLTSDRPLYFETMVFSDNVDSHWSRHQERYETLAEAEAGHARILRMIETSDEPGW